MSDQSAKPAAPDSAQERDDDAALRTRLHFIVKNHAQAELGRKTGIPHQNISRYLRDVKMPVGFCVALCREIGINPAWLMLGEGAPYLADVAADTSRTASDLLELVQAMNSVLKMRLGSLVGKAQQRILRELNDALTQYHEIRERMNTSMKPLYKDLLDEFEKYVQGKEFEKARRIREAVRQVSHICDDEELLNRLDAVESTFEYYLGHFDESLNINRRVFWRELAQPRITLDDLIGLTGDYVMSLHAAMRAQEALEVCDAALALGRRLPKTRQVFQFLSFLRGMFLIDLGDMEQGLPAALRHFQALQGHFKTGNRNVLDMVLFEAGAVTLDDRIRTDAASSEEEFYRWQRAIQMLRYSCAREDPEVHARLCDVYLPMTKGLEAEKGSTVPLQAELLLRALTSKTKNLHQYFLRQAATKKIVGASAGQDIHAAAAACQLARLSGASDDARAEFRRAAKLIDALSPDLTLTLITLAQHHRNAQKLFADDPSPTGRKHLEEADRFFVHYVNKGFEYLRPCLPAPKAAVGASEKPASDKPKKS